MPTSKFVCSSMSILIPAKEGLVIAQTKNNTTMILADTANLYMLIPPVPKVLVTVHGMVCFLERLGGNPSFFSDLAKGETAATEVKRRWNAEGARSAPIAKSLEKPGLET